MRLNITKNFIIAFFVILAIYQTSELWFESFSNHNFFYSFFNNTENYDDDGLLYSLDGIIINQGDDRLIFMKNDIYKSEWKNVFDSAAALAASDAARSYDGSFDWSEIFSTRSVVYKYSAEIESSCIAKMFGFDEGLFEGFSEKIDTIAIMPVTATPEHVLAGFGSRKTDNARFFYLEKSQYAHTIYNEIGSVQKKNDIFYTASVKSGLDLFKGNVFIPQWNGESYEYPEVSAENSFLEDGIFKVSKLERAADVFFDNSASKWSSYSNGVYIYSDENTVVKYYDNGVLELYNYSAGKNDDEDFYSEYKAAVSAIKRDSNIKNEYFLSSCVKDSEKTVFYFDYKINDFTLKLGDEIKSASGMHSAIEVTLNKGKVSRYRRLALDFYLDGVNAEVNKTFTSAVNEVLAEIQNSDKRGGEENEIIENVELAYILNKDKKALLNWIINIGGKDYKKETNTN